MAMFVMKTRVAPWDGEGVKLAGISSLRSTLGFRPYAPAHPHLATLGWGGSSLGSKSLIIASIAADGLAHVLMSALGHKRTYAVQKAMSAVPLIATAEADIRR